MVTQKKLMHMRKKTQQWLGSEYIFKRLDVGMRERGEVE